MELEKRVEPLKEQSEQASKYLEVKDKLNRIPDKRIKIETVDLSDYKACVKLYENNKDVDLLVNCAGFGDCFFDVFDQFFRGNHGIGVFIE